MNKVLSGKVAIITGANQGLGLEIVRHYLQAGASVIMCARNAELLSSAKEGLISGLSSTQKLLTKSADVSNLNDVNDILDFTLQECGACHILVNNAGIYGPKGRIEDVDLSEWIKAIEVNVFGSMFMSRAVLPVFRAQHYGKIIQLSGGGATNPLPNLSAYATSKAAIIRYAETLAEELRGSGVDVNAIAPGALNTRLLDEILDAGPEKVGIDFFQKSLKQKVTGGSSLSLAAQLAVFLASSASNGITGKLISAVWDKWEDWPKHLEELKSTDAYTLRRVTGRDRGFDWGDK